MTERQTGPETLRIVAFAAIVALHTADRAPVQPLLLRFLLDELSRFAVPAFFILSAYFWRSEQLENTHVLLRRLMERVVVPWVIWLAIYGVLGQVGLFGPSYRIHSAADLLDIPNTGGAGYHLWFVSALIVGTAIVATAVRFLKIRLTIAVSLLLYGAGLVLGSYSAPVLGLEFQLGVYRNGVFFAPIFLAVGVYLARTKYCSAFVPTALLLALAAVGQVVEGTLLGKYPQGHDFGIATLGFGILAFLLAARPVRYHPFIERLGRATFAAYLVHALVLEILLRFSAGQWPVLLILTTIAVSFAIPMGVSACLAKTRFAAAARTMLPA